MFTQKILTPNTFTDFYQTLLNFKKRYPKLYLPFLNDKNLVALGQKTCILDNIDSNSPPSVKEEREEIKKYREDLEGCVWKDPSKRERLTSIVVHLTQEEIYRTVVNKFNSKNFTDNVFIKIKSSLKKDDEVLEAVHQEWLQNNTYPFLDGESFFKVEQILNELEAEYLPLLQEAIQINQQTLSVRQQKYIASAINSAIVTPLVNSVSFLNTDQISQISEFIKQCQQLIQLQRQKLCEAALSRLRVVPQRDLLAVLQGESREFIYDDVVHCTLLKLEKYGFTVKNYVPRHSLSADIIKKFLQYICIHGTDEQKKSSTDIMNAPFINKTPVASGPDESAVEYKRRLITLLNNEIKRIRNPRGLCGFFMNRHKTYEKIAALESAVETTSRIDKMEELDTQVHQLLENPKLTQHRSIFAWGQSQSEKHLRKTLLSR